MAAPFTLGLECSACAIGVALAAHLYAVGAMAESNAAPAHMRLVQSALDKPSVIVLGTVVGATTKIALCQIEGAREVIRLKVGEPTTAGPCATLTIAKRDSRSSRSRRCC